MKYGSLLMLLFIIIVSGCVYNPQHDKENGTISSNNIIVHSAQSHIFEKIWMQSTDLNKIPQSILCNNEKEPDNVLLGEIVCHNVLGYIHTYTISGMNMIIYPRSDDFVFSENNPYILSSGDYKKFNLNNNIITLTDSNIPINIEKLSKDGLSLGEIIKKAQNIVISGYESGELSIGVNSKILSGSYTIYNFSYRKFSQVGDEITLKSYIFALDSNIPYYYIYTDSSLNDGSDRKSSMYPIELFVK